MKKFVSNGLVFIALTLFGHGIVEKFLFVDPVDKTKDAIIHMVTQDGRAVGTGFLVEYKKKTFIITNDHVCKAYESNTIYFNFFKGSAIESEIIKSDPESDLCAVKVPSGIAGLRTKLKLAAFTKRFQKAFHFGYPLDLPQTPAWGYTLGEEDIQMFNPSEGRLMKYHLVALNIITYPGNSGSPLLNEEGEIIGVVNMADTRTWFGFAITLDNFERFLLAL